MATDASCPTAPEHPSDPPTARPLAGDRPIGPTRSGRAILGCGSFGGIGSTLSAVGLGLDDAEAFAVMDRAVALGVTIFDTADGYADGLSESTVGAWAAQRGHPVTISTKVGVAGGTVHGRDLSPARILDHANTSRQRLGVERIDMYMIHAADPRTPIEDSLRAFDRLHRDGVIRSLGMCNVTVDILRAWADAADRLGAPRISWVQNEYSLMVRRDEADVLGFCADVGLAYTAYSPLCGGILSGRYRRGAPPPPRSRIAVLTEQYGPRLTDQVHDGLDRLAEFAADRGVSTTGAALSWVMSSPFVAAPLVAPRSPAQFHAVIEAAELALTETERDELASLFPG